MKVHLDTDIGGDIDDLCALALLLSWPDVEITGVTTVLDDHGKRAGFVRYVLALANRAEVPVAAGAGARTGPGRLAADLLPEEEYWPEPVPPMPGPVNVALELLKHNIERGAVIVGIGPFTNFALLERRYPGILRDASICLMGGSIQPAPPTFPSWDYTKDYNVQADSAAAKLVLESSQPTLAPIEVTVQTALRRAYLPELRQSGALGRLIAHQAEAVSRYEAPEQRYGRAYAGLPPDFINFQHDPLTCAVALGWDGVTIETLALTHELVGEQLRQRIDPKGRQTRVVTGVDQEKFNAFWLQTVTGRPSPGC